MSRFILATVLLSGLAMAQVTPIGPVGTGQTVPDPFFTGGPAGQIGLYGYWNPGTGASAGLNFVLEGMPQGYNTGPQVTQEFIYFALNFGAATTPGVSILGGQFYVPLASPTLLGGSQSVWLGPGDVVVTPGTIYLPGNVTAPTRNGARLALGGLPAGNFGVLSMQGYVFDAALSRIFTTNAVNFSIP